MILLQSSKFSVIFNIYFERNSGGCHIFLTFWNSFHSFLLPPGRKKIFPRLSQVETKIFLRLALFNHFPTETPVFHANSVDADRTPCSAVSDLSPYCLPRSLLEDFRH